MHIESCSATGVCFFLGTTWDASTAAVKDGIVTSRYTSQPSMSTKVTEFIALFCFIHVCDITVSFFFVELFSFPILLLSDGKT